MDTAQLAKLNSCVRIPVITVEERIRHREQNNPFSRAPQAPSSASQAPPDEEPTLDEDDSYDDDDSYEDETDEEDWASMGPAALKQGYFPLRFACRVCGKPLYRPRT